MLPSVELNVSSNALPDILLRIVFFFILRQITVKFFFIHVSYNLRCIITLHSKECFKNEVLGSSILGYCSQVLMIMGIFPEKRILISLYYFIVRWLSIYISSKNARKIL